MFSFAVGAEPVGTVESFSTLARSGNLAASDCKPAVTSAVSFKYNAPFQ